MHRIALLAAACLFAVGLSPADADPQPGPGFVKTANVGYGGSIPLEADAAGARLLGKTFYVITSHGLSIYDVSNPALPLPLGHHPLPQTPILEREDVDTNGKILVTGQSYLGVLYVFDVSNPRLPVLLSRLSGAADHTQTCVLDCTWVYGSEGTIVDLRDPRAPKKVGDSGIDGHDVTEVRPGLVATATRPIRYLDARKNPAKPRELASGSVNRGGYYVHGVEWPRAGADRWLLAGTEESGCSTPEDGAFIVMDTKNHERTRTFRQTSAYHLVPGPATEGKGQVNLFCGHWFKQHPKFRDGGLVAMAWYGFGIRFFEVSKTGTIAEKGYFVPLVGQHSSVYWLDDTHLLALEYGSRGIDILTFDPKVPAGPRDPRAGQLERTTRLNLEAPRAEQQFVCPVPR
jgi:hypothetical protein